MDIVFCADGESGHIIASFKFANTLKKSGYNVWFVGLNDSRELIESNGFEFYDMFDGIQFDKKSDNWVQQYYTCLFEAESEDVISKLNPRLIITNKFLIIETIVFYHKYKNAKLIVLFTHLLWLNNSHTLEGICLGKISKLSARPLKALTSFAKRHNVPFSSLLDFVKPLKSIPKFILCSKALEIDRKDIKSQNIIYLGPGIMKDSGNNQFFKENNIPEEKKIIYASVGSDARRFPRRSQHFFNLIIECMKLSSFSEYHLILTVSSDIDKWELHPNDNVSIFNWVPQQTILNKAAIVVTHGGLNTVRESIFYGVPMVTLPLGRDHFDNARRVAYHNLGVKNDIDNISVESLSNNILEVLNDKDIDRKIKKMCRFFKEENDTDIGAKFIDKYLEN